MGMFNTGDYAAHWGITDLYPENEAALRAALASGEPFDTGWYGAKKEIEYARISRQGYGNRILRVEVRTEIDDGPDLVDTAFWKAAGGNEFAGSGYDALMKLGLTEDDAIAKIDEVVDAFEIWEDNQATDGADVDNPTYEELMAKVEELTDGCDAENSSTYHEVVTYCETLIEQVKTNPNS